MSERNPGYFKEFAKNLTVGVGLTGLAAGGYALSHASPQYFQEIAQALGTGELNVANAVPVLCCLGPGVLGFAAIYRAVRIIKRDDPIDR